jgi:pimeloyl-ACP methyl ester carboxylesterase
VHYRPNKTGHLPANIERLREHLRIDRWVVVGVSWGVTLALVLTADLATLLNRFGRYGSSE